MGQAYKEWITGGALRRRQWGEASPEAGLATHESRVGGAGRVRTAASQFCSLPEGSTTDDDQQRQVETTNQEDQQLMALSLRPTKTD